jgi:hypothetical protein
MQREPPPGGGHSLAERGRILHLVPDHALTYFPSQIIRSIDLSSKNMFAWWRFLYVIDRV